MRRHPFHRPTVSASHCDRRGYLLVSVLGTSLIIALLSLAALRMARTNLRTDGETERLRQAEVLARSGLDYAMTEIENNANWPSGVVSGQWQGPWDLGTGQFSWRWVDPGGGDNQQIQSWGRVDGTVWGYRVDIVSPTTVPDLDAAIIAGGELKTHRKATLTVADGNGITHGLLDNTGTMNGVFESQTATGNAVNGTLTNPGSLKTLPNSETLFSHYRNLATEIDYTSLPNGGPQTKKIDGWLLSPNSNPSGATNPDGIYRIDADGEKLDIMHSRIVGTLLVENVDKVQIDGRVHAEPTRRNLPLLLVAGNLEIIYDGQPLSEAEEGNLNPVGTPFADGIDTDTNDTYREDLGGILYATGFVTFDAPKRTSTFLVHGAVICGDKFEAKRDTKVKIQFDTDLLTDPPPGFVEIPVTYIPGTLTRIPASELPSN